jgi:hypothetical protein
MVGTKSRARAGEMPLPSTFPTEAVLYRASSQLNFAEVLAIKVVGQPAKPQVASSGRIEGHARSPCHQ